MTQEITSHLQNKNTSRKSKTSVHFNMTAFILVFAPSFKVKTIEVALEVYSGYLKDGECTDLIQRQLS